MNNLKLIHNVNEQYCVCCGKETNDYYHLQVMANVIVTKKQFKRDSTVLGGYANFCSKRCVDRGIKRGYKV